MTLRYQSEQADKLALKELAASLRDHVITLLDREFNEEATTLAAYKQIVQEINDRVIDAVYKLYTKLNDIQELIEEEPPLDIDSRILSVYNTFVDSIREMALQVRMTYAPIPEEIDIKLSALTQDIYSVQVWEQRHNMYTLNNQTLKQLELNPDVDTLATALGNEEWSLPALQKCAQDVIERRVDTAWPSSRGLDRERVEMLVNNMLDDVAGEIHREIERQLVDNDSARELISMLPEIMEHAYNTRIQPCLTEFMNEQ